MSDKTIQVERVNSITTLTFQGQNRLNLLNFDLVTEFKNALDNIKNDARTRVIILKPRDGHVFSGGVDLKIMKEFDPNQAERFIRHLHSLMKTIMEFEKPVIASVSGACLGGAMEVAMACDFVIADEEAVFGLPEIIVGVPSVIEASLLQRIVGLARAREIILLGETIDVSEAHDMGLVNKVVPKEAMQEECLKLASKLSALSPRILSIQKDIINKWLNLGHDQGAEYSARAFALSFAGRDPREGMEAFLEKRAPIYNDLYSDKP